MAENENAKKVTQTINNAKVTKIKEPEYGKEFVVDRLIANPTMVQRHFQGVRQTFVDAWTKTLQQQGKTKEEIENEINKRVALAVNNIVLRDNQFNLAMKEIVSNYKIEIDKKDIQGLAEMLKANDPTLANAKMEYVELMTQRMVEKELIFTILAKEWNISVTDEEADQELQKMFKETANASVSDIVRVPERFENFKMQMRDQRIVEAILKKFKFKIDQEAILKHAQESRKAAEEALKKVQDSKKEEQIKKNVETVKQQINEGASKEEPSKK